MNSTLAPIGDSVQIEKAARNGGWTFDVENIHELNAFRSSWFRGDYELTFWFDGDTEGMPMVAAVKSRLFDVTTAYPIKGTQDLEEALTWLK